MSILIRGMEMPTSCDECEFCKRDISSYDWCCIPMTNGRNKPLGEPVMKPDWCPLVPVPPHGRLIDLDAIPKEAWRGEKEDLVDELILAPTVIPADKEDA